VFFVSYLVDPTVLLLRYATVLVLAFKD